MNKVDTYLYNAGFIRTQTGYYETPLNSNIFAICDDNENVSYFTMNEATEELVELASSKVGDNNNTFAFTNSLR